MQFIVSCAHLLKGKRIFILSCSIFLLDYNNVSLINYPLILSSVISWKIRVLSEKCLVSDLVRMLYFFLIARKKILSTETYLV